MATEVYVFVQDGCPACTEFLPRITRVSQPYRTHGLLIYAVNIGGAKGGQLAQRLRVDATPTTVIAKGGRKVKTLVGAVDDRAIAAFLAAVR